jgi:hypothetical protein
MFFSSCRSLAVGLAALALPVYAPKLAAEPTRMVDTDIPGFDYKHFDLPRASPRLCQEACLNDAVCRAWTFVKPGPLAPRAACWLKDRIPDVHHDPCCVSGLR